eukprot:CFRG2086T1
MSLFDDSDNETDISLTNVDIGDLKVNENYAKKFTYQKEREELGRLKQKYGADATLSASDSDSESEDEDAALLTAKMDMDIFRTISLIKAKDPLIYQSDVKLFEEPEEKKDDDENSDEKTSDENSEGETLREKKKKPEKKMTLKDYERRELTERGAEKAFGGDESDEDEKFEEVSKSKSYVEELASIKNEFKLAHENASNAIHESSDEDSDGDMFDVKVKSKQEEEDENADYLEWLAGQEKELKGKDAKAISETETLRRYYTDPNLDKNEKFLRDYVLGRMWAGDRENAYASVATDSTGKLVNDDIDQSEDEAALDEADRFEKKINFRFEEEGGFDILSHPRQIGDSVRQKNDKRKLQREAKKARKQVQKEQKKAELHRLKNLKSVEILEKLRKIREITGNDDMEVDINADFDPEAYDKDMASAFDDDYYAAEDLEKPVFESDDNISIENWSEDDMDNEIDAIENTAEAVVMAPPVADQMTETEAGKKKKKKKKKKTIEAWETETYNEYDDDFNMDADYVPEPEPEDTTVDTQPAPMQVHASRMAAVAPESKTQLPITASKKSTKKQMARLLKRLGDKPAFDPEKLPFEQYLEEYYKLDFEDIIGDQPVRFKYREVIPNDFGLGTEEILAADDKDLNSWVSLRKVQKYQPDSHMKKELSTYKKKPEWMKRKVLTSVYGEQAQSKKAVEKEDKSMKRKRSSGGERFDRDKFNTNMVGEDRLASYGVQKRSKNNQKPKK